MPEFRLHNVKKNCAVASLYSEYRVGWEREIYSLCREKLACKGIHVIEREATVTSFVYLIAKLNKILACNLLLNK